MQLFGTSGLSEVVIIMNVASAFSRSVLAASLIVILSSAPTMAQQAFKSPEEASQTLAAALRAKDEKALITLLGPGSSDVVSSGEATNDENLRKAFLLAYDLKHSIELKNDKTAILLIGQDNYPFSIPLGKKDDSWRFDLAAGRDELFARRIGRNESAVIETCLAYVDAQYEYAAVTRVGHLSVYAQRLVSTPGTRNGLYWPTEAGQDPSPLGLAVALATVRGYRIGSGQPYHGYLYKILTRQGANAPDGAHDYIVNGKMIGGFALVAWPAQYGNSGIMTFMVNYDGVVFQKDLGNETDKLAPQINSFDPNSTWVKVLAEH
ncbi:MAG: hypothetical protein OJF62_001999 [Pseudolabrys sp.]|nr:hypothetical protein [Pseudolabrys sp.]